VLLDVCPRPMPTRWLQASDAVTSWRADVTIDATRPVSAPWPRNALPRVLYRPPRRPHGWPRRYRDMPQKGMNTTPTGEMPARHLYDPRVRRRADPETAYPRDGFRATDMASILRRLLCRPRGQPPAWSNMHKKPNWRKGLAQVGLAPPFEKRPPPSLRTASPAGTIFKPAPARTPLAYPTL